MYLLSLMLCWRFKQIHQIQFLATVSSFTLSNAYNFFAAYTELELGLPKLLFARLTLNFFKLSSTSGLSFPERLKKDEVPNEMGCVAIISPDSILSKKLYSFLVIITYFVYFLRMLHNRSIKYTTQRCKNCIAIIVAITFSVFFASTVVSMLINHHVFIKSVYQNRIVFGKARVI